MDKKYEKILMKLILGEKNSKNSYLEYIGKNILLIYGIHGNIIYPIFNFIFKNYKELIMKKATIVF